MTGSNLVQCPMCGWTGETDDLSHRPENTACPACDEVIDFVS